MWLNNVMRLRQVHLQKKEFPAGADASSMNAGSTSHAMPTIYHRPPPTTTQFCNSQREAISSEVVELASRQVNPLLLDLVNYRPQSSPLSLGNHCRVLLTGRRTAQMRPSQVPAHGLYSRAALVDVESSFDESHELGPPFETATREPTNSMIESRCDPRRSSSSACTGHQMRAPSSEARLNEWKYRRTFFKRAAAKRELLRALARGFNPACKICVPGRNPS